jgi:hypothetical protein
MMVANCNRGCISIRFYPLFLTFISDSTLQNVCLTQRRKARHFSLLFYVAIRSLGFVRVALNGKMFSD